MGMKKKTKYGMLVLLYIVIAVLWLVPGRTAEGAKATPTPAVTKKLSSITAVYTGESVLVGHSIETDKLTVMGLYTDGSYEKVKEYTLSTYVVKKEGYNEIKVTSQGVAGSFTVLGKEVLYMDAYYEDTKVTIGEKLERKKITVQVYYTDGSYENVTEYDLSHDTVRYVGQNEFTVVYEGSSATMYIMGVAQKKATELYAAYVGDDVIVGNAPKRKDFYVSVVYNDNSVEETEAFELTPSVVQKEGKNTMVVSFAGLSTEVTVPGIAKVVESITAEYTGFPVVIGKSVANEDIKVTATFNDGTKDTITSFTLSSSVIYQIGDNLITVFCDDKTAYINVRGVEAEIIDYDNSAEVLIKENKVSSRVTLAVGSKADPEKVLIEKVDTAEVKKAMRRLVQTDKYMAFEVSFEDPELEVFLPMTMKVSVPAGYDKENFAVFYTPNRKTIMARMNGEFLSDGTYEFKMFQPGTYIIADITPLIYVESLELEEETLTMRVGRSYSLDPEILPHAATDKTVSYTSSRPKIVTVSENGTLKALKTGTSIITVEAKDGSGKSCKLRVTVVEKKGKYDAEIAELADELAEVETAYDFLDFYDAMIRQIEDMAYELSEKQFKQYTEELTAWSNSLGDDFIEMDDEEWELLYDIVFDWFDDEYGLFGEFLEDFEQSEEYGW